MRNFFEPTSIIQSYLILVKNKLCVTLFLKYSLSVINVIQYFNHSITS